LHKPKQARVTSFWETKTKNTEATTEREVSRRLLGYLISNMQLANLYFFIFFLSGYKARASAISIDLHRHERAKYLEQPFRELKKNFIILDQNSKKKKKKKN